MNQETETTVGLWTQLREDIATNGNSWSKPGLYAVVFHRLANRWACMPTPLRLPLMVFYRLVFWFLRNFCGIELFYTTTVGRRLRIPHTGGIVIHMAAIIGDDCHIRHNVTIGAGMALDPHDSPVIGSRVVIGAGAAIIGKVRVGDDVRIGPNAVVMSHVPSGATIVAAASRIVVPPTAGRQHAPAPEKSNGAHEPKEEPCRTT